MKIRWKKIQNIIIDNPIKFSVAVSSLALIIYVGLVSTFRLGLNMSAGTAISIDTALITLTVTSIGLSISGYIFLNNYFGTLIEGDSSLSSIVEELNKTYILKIVLASIASALGIAFCFGVFFILKESDSEGIAFSTIGECILQHLAYVGSIGTILYNFHFLCHIINPDKLIKIRAAKVVKKQLDYFEKKYDNLPGQYTDSRYEWEQYKIWSKQDGIRNYGAKTSGMKDCLSEQTIGMIKYIHEIEAIITKVIELNAIKGRNRSREEALKFVFADTSVGNTKYERRISLLCMERGERFPDNGKFDFQKYERITSELIEKYVEYYENLVLLRNALIKVDKNIEIKIPEKVSWFVAMMLRITLNRFSNFVKITRLNIGGGYFKSACFNWSDLSDSNLTGSEFSYAKMENSVLVNADLSNSKFNEAILCDADLRNANLGYASLVGADCSSVNLSNAKLTDVIFHDRSEKSNNILLRDKILKTLESEKPDWGKLKKYSQEISYRKECNKTKLSAATLNNVMLNSIDLSSIELYGTSFVESVLTNSLWLNTIKAAGLKMQRANLRNSLAVQCDFSMSDFQSSNLGQMIFLDVKMQQSSLSDSNGLLMKIIGSDDKIMVDTGRTWKLLDFQNSLFADKDFNKKRIRDPHGCSNWMQVNLQKISAVESRWYNTIVNESDFKGAILKNAIFCNVAANWVNMEECDLTYSKLLRVSFRMGKMTSTVFTRAYLEDISFDDANLQGGNFVHASIKNANFVQCNLRAANFSHTYIQDSIFWGCEFMYLYLQSTIFKQVTFDMNFFKYILDSYDDSGNIALVSCVLKLNNEDWDPVQKITEEKGLKTSVNRKGEKAVSIVING